MAVKRQTETAAATMIILICAGWYRMTMMRRELPLSKRVDRKP